MKKILLYFALIISFIACEEETKAPSELFSFIPPNTAVILKSDNLKDFTEAIAENDLLANNNKSKAYSVFKEPLQVLQYINLSKESLICFNKVGRKEIAVTLLTDEEPSIQLDSIANKKVETFKYDNSEIKKYTLEGIETFSTKLNNIFVYSSSKLVLENIIRIFDNQLPQDPTLEKIYQAASGDHSFFINHKEFNKIYPLFFPNGSSRFLANFSDWTVLDFEIDKDEIHWNGVSSATIQNQRLLNLFQGIEPQTNEVAEVVPNNALGFSSFSYDSFENLKANLTEFKSQDLAPLKNESLFNAVQEVGTIYFEEEKAIVLNTIDATIAADALVAYQDVAEDFRGIEIFHFPDSDNLYEAYQPLIKQKSLKFYAQIDHFFVFANNLTTLENIIANYQNRTVLANYPAYLNTKDELSDEASLLFIGVNENLKEHLAHQVEADLSKDVQNLKLGDFKVSALQFIYDNNFAHVNALLQKSEAKNTAQSINQITSIKLPEAIANRPQFVKNWGTKEMEIAVQDETNVLYLYKNNGELHWKKQLDSRIVGDIQQIDIYNNGRLQHIFATQNQVYILDRNGNNVKPFPKKFNNTITQELSVFDYDNNSKYRFVTTQGNRVDMFTKEGKDVKGFKFSKTDSEILQAPKHIRIGRKDYILVSEANGNLHILSRTGETRVPTQKEFQFSNNKWYQYQNLFTTTNLKGELVQVNESGKNTKKDLKLTENHNLVANNTILVTFNENELSINGKIVNLDYGLYTEPQLIEINNKAYIAITDTQTSKVYVFDKDANLISGFPVYGNSQISLANMDNRGKLEFCVKGEDNSVLIYQMN